jgi:glycosyltransferase involved in cell wall biosynthesis
LARRLPNHGVYTRLLFLYGSEGPLDAELQDGTDYLRIESPRRIHQLARLGRYLQQMEPDVVHFHDDLLWPQLLNFGARPWKTVIHAHGGGTAAPQPWKTRLLYAMQRRHADRVVCITEEARTSQIRNVGFRPDRLRVIYNGVNRQMFRPASGDDRALARQRFGLQDDAVIVGFVGRLHDAMKGVSEFIDLIQRLPASFQGLIVGSGPDEQAAKARTVSLGITQRVHFAGLLDNTRTAYHAMDVFGFTSRHEPFGLTIAEAMACRVPVVGFACPGGSGELLTDKTGCVIYDRDLDAMAREVQFAARGGDKWTARLAAASEILVHRHDWDNTVGCLAEIYRELINSNCNKGH